MQFKLHYKIQGLIIEDLEKWTEKENLNFIFLVQLICVNFFQCPRCHLFRYKKLLSTFFSFSSFNFQISCFWLKSPLSPWNNMAMLLLPECSDSSELIYSEATLNPCLWFPNTLHFNSSYCVIYVLHQALHHYWMLTLANSHRTSQRLFLCFIGDNHKCKPCLVYTGKCEE